MTKYCIKIFVLLLCCFSVVGGSYAFTGLAGLAFMKNYRVAFLNLRSNVYNDYNVLDADDEYVYSVKPARSGLYALTSSKSKGLRIKFITNDDIIQNTGRFITIPIKQHNTRSPCLYGTDALIIPMRDHGPHGENYAMVVDSVLVDSLVATDIDVEYLPYYSSIIASATDSIVLDSMYNSFTRSKQKGVHRQLHNQTTYVGNLAHEQAIIVRTEHQLDTLNVRLSTSAIARTEDEIVVQHIEGVSNAVNGYVALDITVQRLQMESQGDSVAEMYFVIYDLSNHDMKTISHGYPILPGPSMVLIPD